MPITTYLVSKLGFHIKYFILSNNRTVWNKGIGWKLPGRKINVGYEIIILGGKFTLKITSNLYFRPKNALKMLKFD